MITKEMALKLELGQVLYHTNARNMDGTPQRWRVNGKCKTWKTRPDKFQVPVKWGLKSCDYLNECNAEKLCLTEDEALGRSKQYRLLKATWEADTKFIKNEMVKSADVAIKNNWDLESETAYTFLFDEGAFDPFYVSKTKESSEYESYCLDFGNEDDETILLGELWIATLTDANKKLYKKIIAKFQEIKDNGL